MVSKNSKYYKSKNLDSFSGRNIVTMIPGDLRVAGCFSFCGGLK
jgi:hypothetical protein